METNSPDPDGLVQAALYSADGAVATGAAHALAGLAPDRLGSTVSRLTQALGELSPDAQRRAARALGLLGPSASAAAAALADALRSPRWTVREAAALALGRAGVGYAPARDALLHVALRDRAPLAREAAAASLAALSPVTPDVLYGTLEHPHARLRCRALRALARFAARDAGVVPAVARALDDGHRKVRRAAAVLLGPLGAAARVALPALLRRRHDGDRAVAAAADAALADLRRGAPPWDWVVLLAEPGGEPGAVLRDVLRHPDFPEPLRPAFADTCRRRVAWHARRRGFPAPPAYPINTMTGREGLETAVSAAGKAASRRDGDEAARSREAAWLLAWLAERLLAAPGDVLPMRAP